MSLGTIPRTGRGALLEMPRATSTGTTPFRVRTRLVSRSNAVHPGDRAVTAAWTARARAYSQVHSSPTPRPEPPRRQRSVATAAAASTLLIATVALAYSYRDSLTGTAETLSIDRWTRVRIESVTPLTEDTSLFRLTVPKTTLPRVLAHLGGGNDDQDDGARPILSLFVKEPTLQIQRAYTPLSSTCFNPDGSATLDLVVKRYPDGEVSRYLHRLRAGDEIEIRAPSVTWYFKPNDWDEVVFIAGGTGVTPAFQCINDARGSSSSSSSSSARSPTMSLMYASPSPSRIFLRPELDRLFASSSSSTVRTNEDRNRLVYHVDRLDRDSSPPKTTTNAQDGVVKVGSIDCDSVKTFVGPKDPTRRRVVVICGPEGMINAVAGPRGRNFSQGPVGGYLRELGYSENEVVKL
ncbi:hypothetical protein JCM3766R1_006960 [Sporobolomyces carnicolor]